MSNVITSLIAAATTGQADTTDPARWSLEWFLDVPLRIVLVLLGATVLRWLVHRLIDRLVRGLTAKQTPEARAERIDTGELPVLRRQARLIGRSFTETAFATPARQNQRIDTLGSVLRSVSTIAIWSVALLMVLSELKVNVAPLLASAGVGGVALGFGAQSLVKDFLSGIFMIVEDQYGVGDVVDTGEVTGTVVDVSLRVTTIRDFNGVIWYIRNGEITRVANRSQGWSTALVDIPVSSTERMDHVIDVIGEAMKGMDADPAWRDRLIDPVEVGGIESIVGNVATIRLVAKCAPNENVPVAREVRERALAALSAAGVKPPANPSYTLPH